MPTQTSLFTVFLRNSVLIIAIVLVATLAGLYASRQKKERVFSGSLGLTVQMQETQDEAPTVVISNPSANVTQAVATVQSWLSEPSFVSTVLTKGGKNVDGMAVEELALTFEVVPGAINSASFQVQFTDGERGNVQKVLESLMQEIATRTTAYNEVTPEAPRLLITTSAPLVAEDAQSSISTLLAAFAAGCVLAILLVAALERKRIA